MPSQLLLDSITFDSGATVVGAGPYLLAVATSFTVLLGLGLVAAADQRRRGAGELTGGDWVTYVAALLAGHGLVVLVGSVSGWRVGGGPLSLLLFAGSAYNLVRFATERSWTRLIFSAILVTGGIVFLVS